MSHASSESDSEIDHGRPTITDEDRKAALERRRRRMASWGKSGSFPVVNGNLDEIKPNNLDF